MVQIEIVTNSPTIKLENDSSVFFSLGVTTVEISLGLMGPPGVAGEPAKILSHPDNKIQQNEDGEIYYNGLEWASLNW